jgi:hypothetical protein
MTLTPVSFLEILIVHRNKRHETAPIHDINKKASALDNRRAVEDRVSRLLESGLKSYELRERRSSAGVALTALAPGHPEGAEPHRHGDDRDAEVNIGFQKGHGFRSLKINFAMECRINPTKSQMMLTTMAMASLGMASDP